MSDHALEVRNLSVEFNQYTALQQISFSLPKGTFMAILGPNGAGKSTLMKAMLGLITPSDGQIWLLGVAPRALPPEQLGYVPQVKGMDRTFPAVAVELVMTGLTRHWPWRLRGEAYDRAAAALSDVGAAQLEQRPLRQLSGGELQRVYLARSLVRRPQIVMLDEPATGIDALGTHDLYRLLETYQKETGATIMMITHDWQAARHHATHILLLNRKMVCFDTPREALSDTNLGAAFGHIGHHHGIKPSAKDHDHD